MKPYDAQREYMQQYFGPKYPHVIVVQGHIPYEWMKENLHPTYRYMVDNDMGPDYERTIIGYGIHGVHNRDGENMYLFHDREHVRQVVEALPEIIVTTDPFGPDPNCLCTVVERPSLTGWRRVIAHFIGVPA